jgi:hypothetical protein
VRKHTIHDTLSVIRDRILINEESECAEYPDGKCRKGYGRVRYMQRWVRAHAAVWMYHFGSIPKGMNVLHRCDNPACCTPSHLYLGDNKQNIKDKLDRDRSGKSLNISKVTRIKELLLAGVSQALIAREYNVGQPTISKIHLGKTWSHVILKGGC